MQRFAKDLVALQPDVILSHSTPTTAALLQQTRTIPIIFATVSDPVGSGFVASLPRPGGNVTGFLTTEGSLASKWLEMLKEIAPSVARVALLFNPATAPIEYYLNAVKAAARSFAVEAIAAPIHDPPELESVVAAQTREPGGGLAAAWPLAARAQQLPMPVIGTLFAGSPEQTATQVAAFRSGLSETGYVEGRNVRIEYRWANNDLDQLPELAADLVRRRVAVLVVPVDTPSAHAAKAATTTIPIVFGTSIDPVQSGLVASLNRPGGNVTGITSMNTDLAAKRLGLLRELLPEATRFAVLVNPRGPSTASIAEELQSAVSKIGGQIEVVAADSNSEIDAAFASFVQKRIQGLLIGLDPLFLNRLLLSRPLLGRGRWADELWVEL
jgi:ABC-type uncharacterized transport system substrate-binding protein